MNRVRDLAECIPAGYDDFRLVVPLSELRDRADGSMVLVRGEVVRVRPFFRRLLDVYLQDGESTARARWFHPPAGMAKSFVKGEPCAFAGRVHLGKDGVAEIIQPSVVTAEVGGNGGLGIVPRYPRVAKVPGKRLRSMILAAAEAMQSQALEWVSEATLARLGLPTYSESLSALHRPAADLDEPGLSALRDGRSPAHHRLAFERMLRARLLAMRARGVTGRYAAMACPLSLERLEAMLAQAFPFQPTNGQSTAIATLSTALGMPMPMSKLLVGDVGCGKTAVAFAAMVQVACCGGQSLFLAPTTVLAEQHYRTLSAWAKGAGINVGLLTGDTPPRERALTGSQLKDGSMDVLVGTHVLLDPHLTPRRYALAVVDEQHRFGVRQRLALRRLQAGKNGWQSVSDGGMVPHLLVMSATPIPRSMALALYGDLELLLIPDKPAGRLPIATFLATTEDGRTLAIDRLRAICQEGGQGYVVCPAIDEDVAGGTSVTALLRSLRPRLAPHRVSMVHGQMGGEQVAHVLADFSQGKVQILLSTTILEVGVDSPRARIMVVMDADRFGLSQLHQLRGRVGRAGEPAECHLVTESTDPIARERLAFLAHHQDGFRIAEEDLRQRGGGDYFGIKQSGAAKLPVDQTRLSEMMEGVQQEAEGIIFRESSGVPLDWQVDHGLESSGLEDVLPGEAG